MDFGKCSLPQTQICSEPPRAAGENADTQALALEILIQRTGGGGGPGICIFNTCLPLLRNADIGFSWATLKNSLCGRKTLCPAHSWPRFRAQLGYVSREPSLILSLIGQVTLVVILCLRPLVFSDPVSQNHTRDV